MTRFESEQRALWSRATQAKQAIERVMDVLDGTFEPSLSMALDRLEEIRERSVGSVDNMAQKGAVL